MASRIMWRGDVPALGWIKAFRLGFRLLWYLCEPLPVMPLAREFNLVNDDGLEIFPGTVSLILRL